MNQEAMARKDRLNMAALAAGYTLSWAGDDFMCWLDKPYDGRTNTDDSWYPDGGWHDAFSLAAALGMNVEWSQVYREARAHVNFDNRFFTSTFGHGPSRGAAQQAAVHVIFDVAVQIGRHLFAKELP